MRKIALAVLTCGTLALAARARSADAAQADAVIALERGALDRWGAGDPGGFLATYAPEVTYFDPGIERRVDGLAAMTEYYRPFRGKIKVLRYELIGPRVQRHGDVAVLSYNLRNEFVQPDGKVGTSRWNSTSVYARVGGAWKVVHSHWSLTKPPGAPGAD